MARRRRNADSSGWWPEKISWLGNDWVKDESEVTAKMEWAEYVREGVYAGRNPGARVWIGTKHPGQWRSRPQEYGGGRDWDEDIEKDPIGWVIEFMPHRDSDPVEMGGYPTKEAALKAFQAMLRMSP
jgi:hypothetical protein